MRPVLVWGNCQAAPIAELLRAPLAAAGLDVVITPPVYLLDESSLAEARRQAGRGAVLVSQPVGDDYHLPGCGTAAMAALLPPDARTLRFAVAHHVGPFPYQTNAHGADGARVLAPVTDYHDLRAIVAAHRRLPVADALAWWPEPDADAVRLSAQDAEAELARRERALDIRYAGALLAPGAMWTMTHPTNAVLAHVARAVLAEVGIDAEADVPAREFLGQRRAPVEPAVARALGWAADTAATEWIVDGRPRPLEEVLTAQLAMYAQRPDVVEDTLRRQRIRLERLGLAGEV